MRTVLGVNASKIQSLLAALLTCEGFQPDLGEDTGARLVIVGVEGMDRTHAVVLAREAYLEKLDAQVKDAQVKDLDISSKAGSRKFDLCKDCRRFRLFNTPGAPAPYTEAVLYNNIVEFLKSVEAGAKETVDESETVDRWETAKVWEDAFGRDESQLIAQDTGDDSLEVFASSKLSENTMKALLPLVPEGWEDALRRSVVNTDRFDMEAMRVAHRRRLIREALTLAVSGLVTGGLLLTGFLWYKSSTTASAILDRLETPWMECVRHQPCPNNLVSPALLTEDCIERWGEGRLICAVGSGKSGRDSYVCYPY
ncbi:putative transmembrane protein, partial [Gregarina niphandrodes]